MQDFLDTMPVKRRPTQISAAEADAMIRASWPLKLGTGSPRAAEAATDLGADDDGMDAPRGLLLGVALGVLAWCAVGLLLIAAVAVWGLL
jgi:hypothetical protein